MATRKILSLVMAAATVYLYIVGQLHPGDDVFLIKSGNMFVNLAFILMAGFAVYLSYLRKFEQKYTYILVAFLGLMGVLVGLGGLAYSSLRIGGVLDLLDYFILLQFGVIFSLNYLSIEHQAVKFPVLVSARAHWLAFKYKLANSVPRPAVSAGRPRKISAA